MATPRTAKSAEVAATTAATGMTASTTVAVEAVDVVADPQLTARAVFGEMTHPLFDVVMPTEVRPARFRHVADADLRPAPMPGEHTERICREVLDMTADEVAALVATGALFTGPGSGAPSTTEPTA